MKIFLHNTSQNKFTPKRGKSQTKKCKCIKSYKKIANMAPKTTNSQSKTFFWQKQRKLAQILTKQDIFYTTAGRTVVPICTSGKPYWPMYHENQTFISI